MAWNFCSSEAAIEKAGASANSTIVASGATLERWSDQAEASINFRTRRDWIGSAASTNFSSVLEAVSSSMIAMNIISYDMTGYTLKREAETMLDVHRDIISTNMAFLDNIENQEKA